MRKIEEFTENADLPLNTAKHWYLTWRLIDEVQKSGTRTRPTERVDSQ